MEVEHPFEPLSILLVSMLRVVPIPSVALIDFRFFLFGTGSSESYRFSHEADFMCPGEVRLAKSVVIAEFVRERSLLLRVVAKKPVNAGESQNGFLIPEVEVSKGSKKGGMLPLHWVITTRLTAVWRLA